MRNWKLRLKGINLSSRKINTINIKRKAMPENCVNKLIKEIPNLTDRELLEVIFTNSIKGDYVKAKYQGEEYFNDLFSYFEELKKRRK